MFSRSSLSSSSFSSSEFQSGRPALLAVTLQLDGQQQPFSTKNISSLPCPVPDILNRGNPSSSSKGIKIETVSQGVTDDFKPTSEHYKDPTSDPVAALPRFHPESKSSRSPDIVQDMSKPDFTKNSSQDELDDSSDSVFDLTQVTIPLSQDGSTVYTEGLDETPPIIERSSVSKVDSVTPKKPKTSERVSDINPCASLSLTNSPSVTSSHVLLSKGTNTSPTLHKTGTPFLRSCPKCNVQFNLLDPLKYHMKRCCPDMVNAFLEMIKVELSSTEGKNETGAEKGKLIMLVSDFYYGRHEGAVDVEQKTYTTFKCFSCLKVLKNNIRYVNTYFYFYLKIGMLQMSLTLGSTLVVCQFRSSTFSDVETHFRASHENTKNLLCPFCLKVSRMATPYMNHYMKHQKKGVHRCTKCRLQFLTYKEKLDHKTQHRTFIKPKELEGLPPGTKVTIRASVGPLHSGSSTTSSKNTPGTSSLQVSPPKSTSTTAENPTRANESKYKTRKPCAATSTASKQGRGAFEYKAKTYYKQKKERNRKNKISIALKNLRCLRGVHKCIECRSRIKDFASHFSIYMHCNFCRYKTNCNKAFVNHMVSSHSNQPTKRFYIFKKHSGTLRGITLVCLKCDFLTDSSGLDLMAKHLSQRKTHTCQVIVENAAC
eukprot:bmy_16251T0